MNTRSNRFGPATAATLLVLLAGAVAPATAQYALDRNLQHGSGGLNPQGPDLGAEMRFRNAIVTGNAPGGLSFRGDVGYRAPGEFEGRLGADDTFSFRRDTLYSGLGGMGIRGTDAIQYQFALTTGMAPPRGVPAPAAVPRALTGATGAVIRPDPIDLRAEGTVMSLPPRWSPGDTAEDIQGLALSPLRAPSAFITTRPFQPAMIGIAQDGDGLPMGITADVLRGITYGPVVTGRQLDRTEQPPTPAEIAGLRLALPDDRMERRLDLAAGSPQASPYLEIIERMRREDPRQPGIVTERRPGDPEFAGGRLETDWRDRLTELRMQLQQPTRADPGRITERIDPRVDPRVPPEEREAEAREEAQRDFSPETIEMLRRAGRIDVLAPGEDVDVYGVHMEAGQRHLARGRYFDAEERFIAALSARPGDPMAAVGRVHAAVGAGMFLSASINLRELLLTNPELTAARYDAELLPRPDRLEDVQVRLVELIETQPHQAREMGLLLAYIGYQTENEQARERGLSAMEGPRPDGEPLTAGDEQMVRLAALLREVWTE